MKKSIITLIIFAFSLNSCEQFRRTATYQNTATTDVGVVINGVRWATRNVDMPGTFVENSHDLGMLFQWNRIKGWNIADTELDLDLEGWDNTDEVGTKWYAKNDPCPPDWRVPTREEFQSLLDARHNWTTFYNYGNARGHLFGTRRNQVFLPAAGFRREWNGWLHNVGYNGQYWSSTKFDDEHAISLSLLVGGSGRSAKKNVSGRSWGFSVRCVAIN